MSIELKARDLEIRTLDTGEEVVGLRGATAFDKAFLEECKEAGVQPAWRKEDEEENDEPE